MEWSLISIAAWLVLGLVLGALFVHYAHSKFPKRRFVLAVGLIVAAGIYLLFALWSSNISQWLLIELGGSLLYGLAAFFGIRGSLWWLAAGWALHPVWDVAIHWFGPGALFAPQWYVVACTSFDLLVAGYVVYVNLLVYKVNQG